MKSFYLFIIVSLLLSCSVSREFNIKDKSDTESLNEFLNKFEKVVAANQQEELIAIVLPDYKKFYEQDEEQLIMDLFNVVTNEGNIERYTLNKIKKIKFISVKDWQGGVGEGYALVYEIYLKDGSKLIKDTWRVNLIDNIYYLSSVMG